MEKTTVEIDGMMCGMCENHINDLIRREFKVKKVSSSHSRGRAVIISEEKLDAGRLAAAIDGTGYRVVSVTAEPYGKKSGFGPKK